MSDTEQQQPLKVFVFQQGTNMKGNPIWWLDLDDEEDAEEAVEAGLITDSQADMHEEDGHISGFFNSKEEAIESAKKRGWIVTNE
jgi:hypothetical protein